MEYTKQRRIGQDSSPPPPSGPPKRSRKMQETQCMWPTGFPTAVWPCVPPALLLQYVKAYNMYKLKAVWMTNAIKQAKCMGAHSSPDIPNLIHCTGAHPPKGHRTLSKYGLSLAVITGAAHPSVLLRRAMNTVVSPWCYNNTDSL